jgi:hypothetical protein
MSRNKKLLNTFDTWSERIKVKLKSYYGGDFSDAIVSDARTDFINAVPEIPHFSGIVNPFNAIIVFAAVMVAFYHPMKAAGQTPEELVKVLYEASEDMFNSIPGPALKAGKALFLSPFFPIFMNLVAKRMNKSDHPMAWRLEYRRTRDETHDWCFEATECGVVKFLRAHGASELAPYCNFFDVAQARTMGLGMQQIAHLGSGDSSCIECMKRGRETEIPLKLKQALDTRVIRERFSN